jgi:hypothetical protein
MEKKLTFRRRIVMKKVNLEQKAMLSLIVAICRKK